MPTTSNLVATDVTDKVVGKNYWGISYEVSQYNIDDFDRAITDEEAHGMIKVLTVPGKDKILGTIHIYPTMAEANKYVAGNWKRAHTPEKSLQWVERFHAMRRRTTNKEVVLKTSVAATETK